MFNSINTNFLSSLNSNATQIFSQLAPYVAFVVGLLLAFFIIKQIVAMIRTKKTYPDDDIFDDIDDDDDFDDDY